MSENKNNSNSGRPVLAAGGITAIGYGFSQFLRLAANLLLTRLLVPEMFGVMAIVSTFIAGFAMISDTGVRQYIYWSKEGINPRVLNTAWTMLIFRGAMICVLMLCLAAVLKFCIEFFGVSAESTYAHPSLPYAMAAMSLCPLITGFQSTKRFEMNRRLALGRLTVLEIASQVIGLAIAILLAWWYRNIWSLVLGNIVSLLLRTIGTHVFLHGHRNSISWDKEQFREIFAFSRWIMASSVLGFLVMHSDWLWLGALVSAETLGIYSIGKNLAYFAFALTDRLSSAVILPELSNVAREERDNLSKTYYSLRKFIDIPVYFGAGVLYTAGPAIVDFLYDSRYQDAGVVLQVLSLILLGTGFMLALECLVALGQVKQRAFITAVMAISLNVTIPSFYLIFGFNGVLYAIVASQFIPVFLVTFLMWKNGMVNPIREIIFLPMYALGLAGGSAVERLLNAVTF